MFDKKEWSRQYYQKKKEDIAAWKREWRRRNPDKLRAENQRRATKIKEWALAHKDQKKHYDEERRNRLRFGGMYDKVLELDKHRCTNCEATENLVVHHVDHNGRNSKAPNNEIDNLLTLCWSCHMSYHMFRRHHS